MTNQQPTIAATSRYSAAQAAKLLGISRRALYYWEENGRIVRSWNKAGGYFTGKDIIKAWRGI